MLRAAGARSSRTGRHTHRQRRRLDGAAGPRGTRSRRRRRHLTPRPASRRNLAAAAQDRSPTSNTTARWPRSASSSPQPGSLDQVPPRRERALRALAGRSPRRRPREHLGLRTVRRADLRRQPHRLEPRRGADHRRDRNGQGDARTRDPPRLRPRRPPPPGVQLQRRPARHDREPAVRLSPRRLHRRRRRLPRRHPRRSRRHAVPRRDRRDQSWRSSRSCCASSTTRRSIRSASRTP